MTILSKNDNKNQGILKDEDSSGILDSDLLSLVGLEDKDILSDNDSNLEAEFYDSENEEEDEHTELKFHEQGWVQAGAMGLAVGLITVFVGTFLSSSFGIGKEAKIVKSEAKAKKDSKTDAAERGFLDKTQEEKDKELSRLQAERAMINQRYQARLLELQREQQLAAEVNASQAESATTNTNQAKIEELRKRLEERKKAQALEKVPEPPEVVVPPPPETSVPVATPSLPTNTANNIDYKSQWQIVQEMWRLQQEIGSFGKGSSTPVLRTELSNQVSNNFEGKSDLNSRSNNVENLGSSGVLVTPEGGKNQDGELILTPEEIEQMKKNSNNNSVSSPTEKINVLPKSLQQSLPINPSQIEGNQYDNKVSNLQLEQEAFLSGKIYERNGNQPINVEVASASKIIAGTQIKGRVKTPIIFIEGDEQAGKRTFSIEITEPVQLKDVVIPAGSLLLGEINTVAPNGIIFLSASLLVTSNREYELPEDTVEIRGDKGKPLIAKILQQGQIKEIAKALGAMAVSGFQQAANLYNQPDQQTIVTDNQTIITSSQPKRNYVAAAINGAMNAVNPRLQEMLRPMGPPPIRVWQVEAGRKVNIFFRRSFSISIAQS